MKIMFFATLMALLLTGWSPVQAQTIAVVSLFSPAGDLIGDGSGQPDSLVSPVDSILVYVNFQGGIGVLCWRGGDHEQWTQLDFASVTGPLAVGYYPNAARFPFQGDQPGLSVLSYRYYNCQAITGEFTVRDIAYDAGGGVSRLDISFTQSCDQAPSLTGRVRYQRDYSTATRPVSWGQLKTLYR